ncbi:malonyl-CoA decarboxylase [Arenibaculum sp.]|jgi:malonyl-CoA decarboxylase|uniref:malonyl-CoA decarboxylase n=1 Tax=Arenibaculum sp. TaxID=2865862 RepID=UPI002E153295|nr:malonyl-CoA decarboxylase [Arenibaculum sp.]
MSDAQTAVPERAGQTTFLDRTLQNLRSAWRDIAAAAREAVGAPPRPHLPREDADRLKQHMRACLEGRGGEVSARGRAAALGRLYLGLDRVGRRNFLQVLAGEFGTDAVMVDEAAERMRQAVTAQERRAAERTLRQALEPGRLKLLTQFNGLPEGVKFLVDMRADLLSFVKDGDPVLAGLEEDLKGLLRSWFDIGFLDLRRITWDSPASLLEKLIAYEAVHAIHGWEDLKNRLDRDRRCFAFFHPRMPDEPLIFVEVALVEAMSERIQPLLDQNAPVLDPQHTDTAIFYSISNAQRGLAGISFGNFLIKRVVDLLAAELPNLKTFATLSPMPGFRRWLDAALAESGDGLLTPGERDRLEARARERGWSRERPLLAEALSVPRWPEDEPLCADLHEPLMRLGARYLVAERTGRRARDPVAHFHLSNGARMERLNFLGDVSENGLRQAAGLMINYRYKLPDIEANHEAYTGEGKIMASAALRGLARNGG